MHNDDLPAWAVSDEVARSWFPEEGILKIYVDYLADATDAPIVFHWGTAMTVLASAAARCSLQVEAAPGKMTEHAIRLWTTLIGTSGDRKSEAMNRGVSLLKRAKKHLATKEPACLPADGSLEAWHDFLISYPNSLMYREELAVLFDQSKRGYQEGLKHWMISTWTGDMMDRITRKDGSEPKACERPRLSLLGAIPPDTFRAKSDVHDWRSGFLPRFLFLPGYRNRWKRMKTTDVNIDENIAKWLNEVACRSAGQIVIPYHLGEKVSSWFEKEVESQRKALPEDLYAHLVRHQEAAYTISAMYALSHREAPVEAGEVIYVEEEDIEDTINALTDIQRAIRPLFNMTQKAAENNQLEEVLGIFMAHPRVWTMKELRDALPQISTWKLRNHVKDLLDEGSIYRGIKPVTEVGGRPAIVYSGWPIAE